MDATAAGTSICRCNWRRFGLNGALCVVAAALAVAAWGLLTSRQVALAKARIGALGGEVTVVTRSDAGPLVRTVFPFFCAADDVSVTLSGSRAADDDLAVIPALGAVKAVALNGTRVTAAGLKHLLPLPQLKGLSLGQTAVTDAALVEVAGMVRLESLDLAGTGITDSGLKSLGSLPRLQALNLANDHVADAGLRLIGGLKRLARPRSGPYPDYGCRAPGFPKSAELRQLSLAGDHITDAGMRRLDRFPSLGFAGPVGHRDQRCRAAVSRLAAGALRTSIWAARRLPTSACRTSRPWTTWAGWG